MSVSLDSPILGQKRPLESASPNPVPRKKRKRVELEPSSPPRELLLSRLVRRRMSEVFPIIPRELHHLWPKTASCHDSLGKVLEQQELADAEACAQLILYAEENEAKWLASIALPILQHCLDKRDPEGRELAGLALNALSADSKVLSSLAKHPIEQWHRILKQDFNRRMRRATNQILQQTRLWHRLDFQHYGYIPARLLPVLMAGQLIPRAGLLNAALAPCLIEALKLDHAEASRWRRQDAHLLTRLATSRPIRETIRETGAPDPMNESAHKVVRRSLFLKDSDPVEQLHAQRAVLSGLLSHLYQRDTTGSCAGTASAIRLLAHSPALVASDLRCMVEDGFMERYAGREHRLYPILPKLSPDAANEGYAVDLSKRPLWKLPSLQAAGEAICLPIDAKSVTTAMTQLGSPLKISPKELLRTMIHLAGMEDEHQDLLQEAIFAFESFDAHPLLRAWESSICSLGRHLAAFTDDFFALISLPLLDVAFENHEEAPEEFLQEFVAAFKNEIYYRAQYLFDPCYHTDPKGKDTAGYVLYDTRSLSDPEDWKPVNNPKRFTDFIMSCMQDAFKVMPKAIEEEAQEWNEASQAIRQAAGSEDFLYRCMALWSQVASNIYQFSGSERFLQELEKLVPHLQTQQFQSTPFNHLACTPWYVTGSNVELIHMGYFGSLDALESHQRWYHGSPTEILSHLIKYLKSLPETEKESLEELEFGLIQAGVTGHAVAITAGHPSLVRAWRSDQLAHEWIKTEVEGPCKDISKQSLGRRTQKRLIESLQNHVQAGQLDSFLKAIKGIPVDLSCKDYRNQLLSIFYRHREISSHKKAHCAELLDSYLFHCLPKKDRKHIEAHAVCIGHLSHGGPEFDDYLSVALNPGTGRLCFWRARDNGKLWLVESTDPRWNRWQLPKLVPVQPELR